MLSGLRVFLRNQQFRPSLIGVFFNPFFLARRALWREVSSASHFLSGPMLDVGCGTKPYRSLFMTENYIGLDLDTETTRKLGVADALYDGDQFPFDDGQFNAVLCNQVLEHVFNPVQFLGELQRVLTVGGRLLITVPFVWDEHEQPYDYARYSSFGLKHLLEQSGFTVLAHRKLLADMSVLFQLLNAYLFKTTRSKSTFINRLVTAVLLAPISLVGLVLGACMPKNEDLFLDQLVVAERLS